MSFRSIALNIQQFCPDLSVIVIKQRINRRYQQIVKYRDWEYLNDDFMLKTEPHIPTTGGSITASYGATGVTRAKTGTSFTPSHVGWMLRFGSEAQAYKIQSVTCPTGTTAQLEHAYSGNTNSLTGSSYTMFKNVYAVSGVSTSAIRAIVYQDLLTERSLNWINANDPERSSTGAPEKYAIVEQNKHQGYVKIELWPSGDSSPYVLRVYVKKIIADLSADTDEPVCSPELLEAWALLDCYRMAAIKNPIYLQLSRDQKLEVKDVLHEEIQNDLSTASLPRRVKDRTEPQIMNDTYASKHDTEDW